MNELKKDGFALFYINNRKKPTPKVTETEKRLCEARRKAEKLKEEIQLKKEFEL
jgi:hypothetical protein